MAWGSSKAHSHPLDSSSIGFFFACGVFAASTQVQKKKNGHDILSLKVMGAAAVSLCVPLVILLFSLSQAQCFGAVQSAAGVPEWVKHRMVRLKEDAPLGSIVVK